MIIIPSPKINKRIQPMDSSIWNPWETPTRFESDANFTSTWANSSSFSAIHRAPSAAWEREEEGGRSMEKIVENKESHRKLEIFSGFKWISWDSNPWNIASDHETYLKMPIYRWLSYLSLVIFRNELLNCQRRSAIDVPMFQCQRFLGPWQHGSLPWRAAWQTWAMVHDPQASKIMAWMRFSQLPSNPHSLGEKTSHGWFCLVPGDELLRSFLRF